MRQITLAFWGGLALLSILWGAANPDVLQVASLMSLREFMIQYSGVLAMGVMSLAMILALRPRWPERWMGGLDKMYRLHKWLGIGGLVLAVSHWLIVQAPKWATGLGLMQRGQRGPRAEITDPVLSFLMSLRGTAEGLGEKAFYLAVILIVVALVTRIPYRWFHRLHRLFPVAYLVLVFHAAVLFDYGSWLTPLGLIMALLLLGGTWAALVSLFGQIGRGRLVTGTVARLRAFPGVKSLETVIDMGAGWPGHRPGQFAFAMSDPKEGPHPYTIASAWDPAHPQITFVTKALGDHTADLAEDLAPGQEVRIEGPYGCFTFEDGARRQIWIGGGIGITPFIARMKYLAAHPEEGAGVPVDLFHSTAEVDEEALARLREDAAAAGITLHVLIDARDGRLDGARIREAVPEWRDAGIWFCGPVGFGRALRKDFAARGFAVNRRFHQELFRMR